MFDHSSNGLIQKLLIAAMVLGTGWGFENASAEVKLPALFSNGMVLQQNKPIVVWGWADPNEQVSVSFRKQTVTTTTKRNGSWEAWLNPEKTGAPDTMVIQGKNRLKISNILVGEVWLCSGQSNMAWPVSKSLNADKEISLADWPQIRLFTVEHAVADKPQDDVTGHWQTTTPETIKDFSAVGFYFGRYLHTHLEVPVGLIHSSWGGTPAEAWTKLETLQDNMDFLPIVERFKATTRNYSKKKAAYDEMLKRIELGEALPEYHLDPGNQGIEKGWANSDFDDSSWNTVDLPNTLESANIFDGDGAVWFRKEVQIPEDWAGKPLVLSLGPIDDFDVTYFNGKEIGYTKDDMPNHRQYARNYLVSEEEVKPGTALIAVRVFDRAGEGGFLGGEYQLRIWPEREETFVDLAGAWKYAIEIEFDPFTVMGPGGSTPRPPMGPDHPHRPAGLYNAMIHPLAPFPIQGVVWYQGESNTSRAYQYRDLLANMISDWRMLWKLDDFHFGIVQLANYGIQEIDPGESEWAELREAQADVAKLLPRIGLVCTIDIGKDDDIHPRNKQDVGKRLSLWALNQVYREEAPLSGPTFSFMNRYGNHARIFFSRSYGKLVTLGKNQILGFTIAGRDRKFLKAEAIIRGISVIVWNETISDPLAVRYGWADNPECNLYNDKGLPAVPFRTDNWPGITINRR